MRTRTLTFLFLAALVLRLAFSFYFQQFYFGRFEYKYGDGLSYLSPIINFINNGEYRGDAFLDDSKYFRPPVYPAFLGAIYLLVSEQNFDYVVAGIQSIIGAFSVILLYRIVLNISQSRKAALISGILFALYPFSILWTPLIYTETVQLFLIFSLVCLGTNLKISIYSTLTQGALVGLILLTKQYLALIVIVPIYIILFSSRMTFRDKATHLSLLMLSFAMVLLPWTVRNYISSSEVIIFFGKTSGFRNSLDDMVAFTRFANKFNENTTEHIDSVAEMGVVKFTKHQKFSAAHERDINAATYLAYQCGGSFVERRNPTSHEQPPHGNCNEEVIRKFDALSALFWREVPLWEALETRRDALWKVVSKSNIINKNLSMSENGILKYILLKYRIVLLVLGFSGILCILLDKAKTHQQKVLTSSLLVAAIAFYLFFCLILVSAEMRYLLTPDLLISLFGGVTLAVFFRRMLSYLKTFKSGEVKEQLK
jgi:4-amino-4-deoxy-L-arabinose transferase-like glycosyltransferase